MKTYSHIIEIKKFMEKCLVCDIQVQDISLSASGLNVQTNKWLHLEDWLGIDAAIENLLYPFRHSETLDGFETDNFHIGGAIRVDCKKKKVSRSHVKILGTDKAYLPIALDIQVTKINTKALMEQITHFEEQLKNIKQTSNGALKEEEKTLVHNENMREYDPTCTEQVSNDYVPYTASVKTPTGTKADTCGSALSDNEPYSPKPVCLVLSSPDEILESPTDIPTYKPARIGLAKHPNKKEDKKEDHIDNQKEEQPHSLPQKTSPVNSSKSPARHASKRPSSKRSKTINTELFGTDDSDQDLIQSSHKSVSAEPTNHVVTPLHASDRLVKESKRKRYKLRHEEAQKSPLDCWLSKGSIQRAEKPDDKPSKKSARYPTTVDTKMEAPKKPSFEQNRNQVEMLLIDELTALNDKIKSKRKSPPPVMEMLTLTHLSTKEILDTFEEFKPKLDEIFSKYSKKARITGFDGINHMKTIMLIDDKKQLKMMNFLRENYQPEEKGVPSLTDLYINALVPEWTVNMFMKEFSLTRKEAIERLHAQEESLVYHNNEGLDLSGPL